MTTKDFQNRGLLRIFLSYFKPHRRLFALDMTCAFLIAVVDLAFPLVSRTALYTWLPEKQFRVFFVVMALVVAAYVLRSGLYFVVAYWGHTFGIRVEADIRLHPDAEGVAPVGHHKVQPRAQYIGRHHQRHHDEEHPELLFRQPGVQRGAGHQRKRQIHHGDKERAGHIQREQAPVGLEIGQEYPQQAAVLEIFRCHGHPRSALHIRLIIVPHFPRFCKSGRRAARSFARLLPR